MRLSTPTLWLTAASMLWVQSPCHAQASAAELRGTAGRSPQWPDTVVAHLEALALLQTLNSELLSHDSATLTLDRWCAAHQLASPPLVIAEKLSGVDKPPTALQRQELGVTATEPVRYRRVRLRCGKQVLSVAENWYVPGRLSLNMNRQLETTDVPFGRVVQSLHFSRHILEATLLWSPLPPGWDVEHSGIPHRLLTWPDAQSQVLRHRAVLVLPDGRPISEVVESYTAQVLAFPEPKL